VKGCRPLCRDHCSIGGRPTSTATEKVALSLVFKAPMSSKHLRLSIWRMETEADVCLLAESGRREGCPSRLPHHRTCGSAYGGSWQSLRTQQPLFLCHADRCPDAQSVGFIAPGQDQRWSCSACQVQPFPSCESVRVFPARCSRYYGLC
jgi:hypothetical protein